MSMSQPRVVRFLIWFLVTAGVLSLSGRLWNKTGNLSEMPAFGFGGSREKTQKQALALEKDIPAVHLRVAANLIRKSDFPKALEELQEAKRLDPENIETGLLF